MNSKTISKYFFTVIFSLLTIGLSHANEGKVASVLEDSTWTELATKHKESDIFPFRSVKEYEAELKKWNPHIKTDSPKRGDRIYIKPPYSPFISWKYSPPLDKDQFFARKFNLLGYYSASYAKYREELSSVSIDYKLNSPGTLGLIGRNLLNDSHSLSYSAYFSYITPNNVKGLENDETDLPLEFGTTLYHEFATDVAHGLNVYYGADIERFSTVNEEELNNQKLKFDSNNLLYLTLGSGLYLKNTFMKVSGSYSVYSSSSAGSNTYSGVKGIVFIGQQIFKRATCSAFAKYHKLSKSGGEMSGFRVGLGLGMRLY